MKSNIIDIEAVWIHGTAGAVLIALDEVSEPVWIPRSQCEVDGSEIAGATVTISLPERVAVEKGLV